MSTGESIDQRLRAAEQRFNDAYKKTKRSDITSQEAEIQLQAARFYPSITNHINLHVQVLKEYSSNVKGDIQAVAAQVRDVRKGKSGPLEMRSVLGDRNQ